MPSAQEKLAASLEALHDLQAAGQVAIRSAVLSRMDRQRLVDGGFLQEVIKGWYIPSRPDEQVGESTAWYAAFWTFCAQYLEARFAEKWSLGPEQSLLLHAGNRTVPRQLLIRADGARNKPTQFPYGTSIYELRARLPAESDRRQQEGLRLFSIEAGLVEVTEAFFQNNPTEACTLLSILPDASSLLVNLLEGGRTRAAGRLAGAFRHIGRPRIADEILAATRAALHDVRETNPFDHPAPMIAGLKSRSPYVHRIHLLWDKMRGEISEFFPAPPGLPHDSELYEQAVDEAYIADAYNSLSIEGYHVTPELIERVREGAWNPDGIEADRQQRDAMAARGYWQAFQAVRKSVRRVLKGENPGLIADEDHGGWYRELFAPSVTAGLLETAQLAGYRNGPVYIRKSLHVPPNAEAVRDLMPTYFELLSQEDDPGVRVVLGHFIFVYIHPYFDGNGRMGRFLMNVMMAGGGYPWTIIQLKDRTAYMAALEQASTAEDIAPFAKFLASQMKTASHA